MHSTTKILGLAAGIALLAAGAMSAQDLRSPAVCGLRDTPETGIQGDIPTADQNSGRAARGYNCGLSLIGELAAADSAVQASGHCAYVRIGGSWGSNTATINVVDVSDPKHPTQIGSVPIQGGSETFQV